MNGRPVGVKRSKAKRSSGKPLRARKRSNGGTGAGEGEWKTTRHDTSGESDNDIKYADTSSESEDKDLSDFDCSLLASPDRTVGLIVAVGGGGETPPAEAGAPQPAPLQARPADGGFSAHLKQERHKTNHYCAPQPPARQLQPQPHHQQRTTHGTEGDAAAPPPVKEEAPPAPFATPLHSPSAAEHMGAAARALSHASAVLRAKAEQAEARFAQAAADAAAKQQAKQRGLREAGDASVRSVFAALASGECAERVAAAKRKLREEETSLSAAQRAEAAAKDAEQEAEARLAALDSAAWAAAEAAQALQVDAATARADFAKVALLAASSEDHSRHFFGTMAAKSVDNVGGSGEAADGVSLLQQQQLQQTSVADFSADEGETAQYSYGEIADEAHPEQMLQVYESQSQSDRRRREAAQQWKRDENPPERTARRQGRSRSRPGRNRRCEQQEAGPEGERLARSALGHERFRSVERCGGGGGGGAAAAAPLSPEGFTLPPSPPLFWAPGMPPLAGAEARALVAALEQQAGRGALCYNFLQGGTSCRRDNKQGCGGTACLCNRWHPSGLNGSIARGFCHRCFEGRHNLKTCRAVLLCSPTKNRGHDEAAAY